ncbi:MAG: hypothetical protein QOF40_2876 [Actinomycetota bacterium]|nr:hypothetical protein [Actinomycetota bacterium]
MSADFEAATEGLGDGRREFLKKMAIGTAFTVPVVSSFTMAGIQAVYAQTPTTSGRTSAGNANATTTTTPGTTTSTSTTTTTAPNSTTTTTRAPNSTIPG